MSRSFKKTIRMWCSKAWYQWNEHSLRGKVKRALHKAETADFDWDPDRDWEDAYMTNKSGAGWGTACGWSVLPNPDDSLWDHASCTEIIRRK